MDGVSLMGGGGVGISRPVGQGVTSGWVCGEGACSGFMALRFASGGGVSGNSGRSNAGIALMRACGDGWQDHDREVTWLDPVFPADSSMLGDALPAVFSRLRRCARRAAVGIMRTPRWACRFLTTTDGTAGAGPLIN